MTGFGRVCVAVLGDIPPTSEEWSRWVALLSERRGTRLRVLVETHSGPNAAQRKGLAEALRDDDVRFAILTDSLIVRGIVTALAWLGLPHHAFSIAQSQPACNYLELDSSERSQLLQALERLRRESAG
jgi:hypothetical protein